MTCGQHDHGCVATPALPDRHPAPRMADTPRRGIGLDEVVVEAAVQRATAAARARRASGRSRTRQWLGEPPAEVPEPRGRTGSGGAVRVAPGGGGGLPGEGVTRRQSETRRQFEGVCVGGSVAWASSTRRPAAHRRIPAHAPRCQPDPALALLEVRADRVIAPSQGLQDRGHSTDRNHPAAENEVTSRRVLTTRDQPHCPPPVCWAHETSRLDFYGRFRLLTALAQGHLPVLEEQFILAGKQ